MQDAIILYENGKAIGGEGHPTNASGITFDPTGTDLVSTTAESAIKEVYDNTTTQIETRTIQLSANSEVTTTSLSVSGSGEKTGSITIAYRGFYFISVYKALLKITLNADVSVGYEGDDAYGLTSPPFFLEAGTYSYVYYGHDSGSAGYVRKVR